MGVITGGGGVYIYFFVGGHWPFLCFAASAVSAAGAAAAEASAAEAAADSAAGCG